MLDVRVIGADWHITYSLRQYVAMTLRLRVLSFEAREGSAIYPIPEGVTVIVGGNNSGKSRLLRDIHDMLSLPESSPVVLTTMQIERPTSEAQEPAEQLAEAEEWLRRRMYRIGTNAAGQDLYSGVTGASGLTALELVQQLAANGYPLWLLSAASVFVKRIAAGSMTTYAASAGIAGNAAATDPVSEIHADGDLEAALSSLSTETFGVSLTFDRVNTPPRLRVGRILGDAPPFDHPTREYRDEVRGLPALEDQGEGMKSFVGHALTLSSRPVDVMLIDEPEAFLHPPQARALGRWIGQQAARQRIQVITATHDRDFVLGLVNSGEPVTLLRLTRSGNVNSIRQLSPEVVEKTFSDPVLRYSNVLQGLFHSRVVLCEYDSDCRFFGAALDDLGDRTGRRFEVDDCLFVPTGGKGDSVKFVRALAALGIETTVIFDFDGIDDRKRLKAIVEAHGHEWDIELDEVWNTVNTAVTQGPTWPMAKNSGLAAIPAGKPRQAADALLSRLASAGILIIHVGEMEDFDKAIAVRKSPWVNEALSKKVHSSREVAAFVTRIITT